MLSQEERNKLIENNICVAYRVARKYYSRYGNKEDLISIALLGLVECIDKDDGRKDCKFSTFAYGYINYKLLSYFDRTLKQEYKNNIVQNENHGQEDDDMDMILNIPDETCNVEQEVERKMSKHFIYDVMDKLLNDTQKKVICWLYGLECKEKTKEEVADILKVSHARIRRIEQNSLKTLHEYLYPKIEHIPVKRKNDITERQKEILKMSNTMTLAEIAKALNLNRSTVTRNYQRAITNLNS